MKKYEMIEIQTNIEKIYKEVFGIPDIAEDTNFFEIGGNSILAAKVVQKIKTCLGINLAIQDIFEYVTVNLLISYIAKIYNEKTKMEEERYCNEETKEAFELTEIQKAYLIGRQGITGEGKVASHYYVELECETVDILRLEEAWNVVVVRQPALRTIIDVKAMKQKILTRVQDYKIELLDFEEDLKGFYELRRDMEDQVLDISRWPVFDIRVSKLKDKFRIHVSMDNMILDGTAICAVLDEWNKLYKGEVLKSDIGKKTFKDYVNYLKTLELSSEYSMAQEYWNKKIVNMPPRPELPLLNKNVNGEFYRLSTVLQKEKWNVLKMLSAKYGITPSNVLLTSFSEVLYRWGKENKFTINLTINKKALLDSGYAKVLGEFTDTILVEVNAGKKRNFIEKCKSIQNELLNNLKYSSYNGVAVQRDWTKEHGFLMGTAFPIVFTSLLGTADLLDMPGKISYGLTQTPQVWLDYQVSEIAGKLYLNWDVLRGKYDDGVIAQMFSCYLDSLEKMTDRRFWETTQKNHIGNFQSSLPKEDRDATLIKEESLYKGFERSYLKNPDKIAIITPKGQYTYCECYQKAVKIGSYIIGKKIVGILMDKGMLQIASILAAAMVSTTYVPIDINNPKERIKTIIEQASVELILTTQAYLTRLKGMTCENVCVDLLEDKCVQEVIEEQPYNKEAYIIFTSGTTGIPKGVLIEHSNANNTILDINRRFSIKENDSVLGLSNIAFDLSVFDIFGIFEAGGTLVLPEDVSTKEPKVWVEMIEKNSITICNLVPMRMEMLYTYVIKNEISKESLKSIRLILISGEKVPLDLPDKIHSIMPNARIVCLGGATEASIWSNYYEPKEINNKWFSIPYGYPLTNQKYYVMNADGLICPDNVPGELCIAGEGLAKEYVNDKKLTIEKFQYNEDIEQRIYKTGDRGVCVEGCIWYLGREDTQIKRRGYRIELGEIESILNSVTGIKASKVVYKDSQLLAFVVPEQDFSWEISDIETIIKGKLPQFNLPDSITILERFPENINGKIDMAKLCDYANNKIETKERLENNIEKQIAEVWRRILGLKETIIYDVDFFQCGGNSLKAVEVIAEINHLFQGLELEIKDLFLNSTIKKISLKVEDELKKFMIVEEGTI